MSVDNTWSQSSILTNERKLKIKECNNLRFTLCLWAFIVIAPDFRGDITYSIMMTSAEIRQSFMDFFTEKQHTIVSSASLMPQSPGLLFTNAGMNQFVPYFLGVWKAPYNPPRAADTQKCIRAGGKHNDLEDVGYDTYHHTFFEMLGNWSFGDYFKKEAIQWAWELIVERWKVPANRLYATVYAPDKSKGDPGEFDQEAWDIWAELFRAKGLNPDIHIVNGNVKDNFWMMGDTGPCGPCSELHVDLSPEGATQGAFVNQDSDQCIEIWNLVFIQYNAETDGTFRELPSKHVDTGMGFERACSIIQTTKNFTDFNTRISNYATDVFTPLFRKIEELSGRKYQDVYPTSSDKSSLSPEVKEAVAFRVIADHIRTLSFSIADGILPGNNGRNYVLRRILRRAVRYGRQLGFSGEKTFLANLVDVLVENFGEVFPELSSRSQVIKDVLAREEASFNETLDRGLDLFEQESPSFGTVVPAGFAFKLYDTYGFPIDLTQLLAEERGMDLDREGFEILMDEQRQRARAARKSEVVRVLDISSPVNTEFIGAVCDSVEAEIREIHESEGNTFIITDKTPFYTEMGGQIGDTGTLEYKGEAIPVFAAQQIGTAVAHIISTETAPALKVGEKVLLTIDVKQRRATEAHHTATHLLHKALRMIVSEDVAQQGSLVTEERLRFDFNSGALAEEQLAAIEEQVNDWIASAAKVYASEVLYEEVKKNSNITQFFGDKYGDVVRVVQVGGGEGMFDGVSMELCGGTHVNCVADIGLFKIKSEGAIASGVRRIEAVCGDAAKAWLEEYAGQQGKEVLLYVSKLRGANERLADLGYDRIDFPVLEEHPLIKMLSADNIREVNLRIQEFKIYLADLKNAAIEAEKALKKAQAAAAVKIADNYLAEALASQPAVLIHLLEGSADLAQELLNGLKKRQFTGSAFFVVDDGDQLNLAAYAGESALANGVQSGKLIQKLAPLAGGKGGGRPDQARGSAVNRKEVAALLQEARKELQG